MAIKDDAKRVFDIEIETLQLVRDTLGDDFEALVNIILENKYGRVIITGMGKSGHIGRKIAATMSSLGTPAYFLHPAEGTHGDLGVVTSIDTVIALSNSGETSEVISLIPSIKRIGAKLISITCREGSTLGKHSDLNILLPVEREACLHNLAPTSSTTAALVLGDALAITLSLRIGFKPEDFAVFHPNGTLGRKLLLRVKDILGDNVNPTIEGRQTLKDVILKLSSTGLGAVNVIDGNKRLIGIITDGDLKRIIEKNINTKLLKLKVEDIMTCNPITVQENELAVVALRLMEETHRKISVLPVIDEQNICIGIIRIHDIIKLGIS